MFDVRQLSISQHHLAETQILPTCSSKIFSDPNCDGFSAQVCRQSSCFQRVGGNSQSSWTCITKHTHKQKNWFSFWTADAAVVKAAQGPQTEMRIAEPFKKINQSMNHEQRWRQCTVYLQKLLFDRYSAAFLFVLMRGGCSWMNLKSGSTPGDSVVSTSAASHLFLSVCDV